ncbi:hypothetical protein, partial [Sphingosinicella sp.]|uniref:hypothetical protein n=1 Tax=Sphingosinicella sp. TaxID=1917971 RepID=UPI0025F92317
ILRMYQRVRIGRADGHQRIERAGDIRDDGGGRGQGGGNGVGLAGDGNPLEIIGVEAVGIAHGWRRWA